MSVKSFPPHTISLAYLSSLLIALLLFLRFFLIIKYKKTLSNIVYGHPTDCCHHKSQQFESGFTIDKIIRSQIDHKISTKGQIKFYQVCQRRLFLICKRVLFIYKILKYRCWNHGNSLWYRNRYLHRQQHINDKINTCWAAANQYKPDNLARK